LVRDRVALDRPVRLAHIVVDEERVGDGPFADEASPNKRLRG
jgi:hypothetical protein